MGKCSCRTKNTDVDEGRTRTASAKNLLSVVGCAAVLLFVLLFSVGCEASDISGKSVAVSGDMAGNETEVKNAPEREIRMTDADRTEFESASAASKGDILSFGSWEEEPLSWIVLERSEDRLLLITENIIKTGPYHKNAGWISWEKCSLRFWLNHDFYHAAFNRAERSVIMEAAVSNNDNRYHGTDGGPDTKDWIFLLSADEAKTYFPANEERACHYLGTESWWWLRTPGKFLYNAAVVRNTGVIYYYGKNVHFRFVGIRPAMWIDLSAWKQAENGFQADE